MNILHSKIYGQNQSETPLLVFHGLFGMLDNWGSFGREFGELMPVHLIDLRNHGKSFHSEEMSVEAMVGDIKAYIEYHGLEKVNLLGHSLGGKVVMQFSIVYPESVAKLIVADIAPKAYPPHHQGVLKALNSIDLVNMSSRKDVEIQLSKYIPEPDIIQFLLKNLYWTEDKKLSWRFNLDVLTRKYETYITSAIKFGIYQGETLFLAGDRSHYILPQDSFLIRQQFPHAEIKKIINAGHWLHAENPKDFKAAVKEFLIH
ncbi:alpha/beta fold hydrolase [Elizabethkingia argentiflava]|uniref:Alpha/beta fold hydrolase n=1 Tax=Elizabethkingia argenteiflava TaxID=2681556 RepID=A0A845PTJ9_9FLAO|nr:alpha/beta fold hydrolase [Elizabethkingia argenteiflava]NAW50246.1 alpha/beta fold hydrolase [Elizabethkingia argenteiflava]